MREENGKSIELAKVLHEAGREAVEKRAVLVKDPKFKKFVEWEDLPEDAREGRIIQAKYLLERYLIIPLGDWEPIEAIDVRWRGLQQVSY